MYAEGIVPKEGDVVTFSFDSFTRKSVPLYPKLERIRKDMAWEDVLRTHFFDSKTKEGEYLLFMRKKPNFRNR